MLAQPSLCVHTRQTAGLRERAATLSLLGPGAFVLPPPMASGEPQSSARLSLRGSTDAPAQKGQNSSLVLFGILKANFKANIMFFFFF